METMSTEAFEILIQESNFNSPRTYFKIARSNHPKALNILKTLYDYPNEIPYNWGSFKQINGFPKNMPDNAHIMRHQNELEIALAIAGDEIQFSKIIDDNNTGTDDSMMSAFRKLMVINNDKSIRFIVPLLNESDIYVNGFPLSVQAASALSKMIENPQSIKYENGPKISELNSQWVEVWKLWWIKNSFKYGCSGEEVFLGDEKKIKQVSQIESDSDLKKIQNKDIKNPEIDENIVDKLGTSR